MNEVGPKKLIRRRGVNQDRHGKERQFNRRDFWRPVRDDQQKHPREQNHRVPIRKLPAAGISVAPKDKHYRPDDQPDSPLELAALTKKKDKKRAGEKDRTTEGIKSKERETGIIIKTFEQAFLHVPWDCADREEAALIPRLSHQVRDVRVSEIENRIKAREVIGGSQQAENYGDDQKPNKSR